VHQPPSSPALKATLPAADVPVDPNATLGVENLSKALLAGARGEDLPIWAQSVQTTAKSSSPSTSPPPTNAALVPKLALGNIASTTTEKVGRLLDRPRLILLLTLLFLSFNCTSTDW
jgi:hypothetical protein